MVHRNCKECGKPLYFKNKQRMEKQHFCNKECYYTWQRKDNIKERNRIQGKKDFLRFKRNKKKYQEFIESQRKRLSKKWKNKNYLNTTGKKILHAFSISEKSPSRIMHIIETRKKRRTSEKHSKLLSEKYKDKDYKNKIIAITRKNSKKIADTVRKYWENPNSIYNTEIREKIKKGLKVRPTKPEKRIDNWMNEAQIPFDYMGDWKFWVGSKNPDWKHKILNKLIEFNGYPTHTKQEEIEREEYFKKRGFEVLFLHYADLKNKEGTIEKIKQFEGGDALNGS